ncbi:hypothetical protein AAFF_G00161220 [Aldrovandia affinis]|uniref:Uncharacterized protein n=1 Tax=Aldrovandia affinis TaxID=143900 RepID=A0AAD7RMJ5_9TELE|nr:hypothetical protein AAFF_G00161220 [Aldrovandia affinis]
MERDTDMETLKTLTESTKEDMLKTKKLPNWAEMNLMVHSNHSRIFSLKSEIYSSIHPLWHFSHFIFLLHGIKMDIIGISFQ